MMKEDATDFALTMREAGSVLRGYILKYGILALWDRYHYYTYLSQESWRR